MSCVTFIDLEMIQAGLLILQVIFMYLSSYPFIIAVKFARTVGKKSREDDGENKLSSAVQKLIFVAKSWENYIH